VQAVWLGETERPLQRARPLTVVHTRVTHHEKQPPPGVPARA
jgi:hypothetical protein